ncbi:MAG: hypothetical protein AAF650_03015 [Pseudomonadota bacterium]
MTPGEYLQKRRAVSGYSLASLAREVIAFDRYGNPRTYGEEQRVQRRLLGAENDHAILSDLELALVAGFVRLDPTVYRDLEDLAEHRIAALPYRFCRCCGATETTLSRRPFSGLPGQAAHFVSNDLCSACAEAAEPRLPQITVLEDAPSVPERIQ